jgi:hypothetical protein
MAKAESTAVESPAAAGKSRSWTDCLDRFSDEINRAVERGCRLTVRAEIGSQNGKVSQLRTSTADSGVVSPLGRKGEDPVPVFEQVWTQAAEPGFFGSGWIEVDLFGSAVNDVRSGIERVHKFN